MKTRSKKKQEKKEDEENEEKEEEENKDEGANLWKVIVICLFWSSKQILTCLGVASLSSCCVWPYTGARVLVEVQTSGASYFGVISLDAVVEFVASSWIFMGEKSV